MKSTHTITLSLAACLFVSLPLQGEVLPTARAVLKMLRKPPTKISSAQLVKRRGYMYAVSASSTPAKRTLSARLRYRKEIQTAGQLHDRLRQTSLLSLNSEKIRQDIERTIVNKTLRKSLLTHLEKKEISAMLVDLENYYHLASDYFPTFYSTMFPSERFARDAVAYLRAHPHKPNWPLRYVLKTEGIDPVLKEEIQYIIDKQAISEDNVNQVVKLLQTAYEQYQRILVQSAKDETMEATVATYKYVADELEAFTAANKRPPIFHRTNEQERDLFNLVTVLAYYHRTNGFEQVLPYIHKIYTLLESFPSPRYDEATTLREFTNFIKQYDDLPKGVHARDLLNQRPYEDMLYESILYWKKNSPAFQEQINTLILRKTIGTEYLPPSFTYY